MTMGETGNRGLAAGALASSAFVMSRHNPTLPLRRQPAKRGSRVSPGAHSAGWKLHDEHNVSPLLPMPLYVFLCFPTLACRGAFQVGIHVTHPCCTEYRIHTITVILKGRHRITRLAHDPWTRGMPSGPMWSVSAPLIRPSSAFCGPATATRVHHHRVQRRCHRGRSRR